MGFQATSLAVARYSRPHYLPPSASFQFVPLAVAFKVDPSGLPTFMKVLAVLADMIIFAQPFFYCNLAVIKEGCICVKREEIWEEYLAISFYSDAAFAFPLTTVCIFGGGSGV